MTGYIFNIQRFSTHDGPGIRTTVFLKGCPLRCYWCQNPESQSISPVLLVNQGACTVCGRCMAVCPNGGISFRNGQMETNRQRCTVCGSCVEVCLNQARDIAGYAIETEDVIKIVSRDEAMYRNSGGGVTLSGGEVTAQPQFARSLLVAAKQKGFHTAIETCGYTKWEVLKAVLEYTDLVLYDIKCVDSKKHQQGTGVDNHLIIENAKRTAALRPIIIRMPLIPGFNDQEQDVKELAMLVQDQLHLDADCIELLPYNNLGEDKYVRMGIMEQPYGIKRQSEEELARLQSVIDIVFGN